MRCRRCTTTCASVRGSMLTLFASTRTLWTVHLLAEIGAWQRITFVDVFCLVFVCLGLFHLHVVQFEVSVRHFVFPTRMVCWSVLVAGWKKHGGKFAQDWQTEGGGIPPLFATVLKACKASAHRCGLTTEDVLCLRQNASQEPAIFFCFFTGPFCTQLCTVPVPMPKSKARENPSHGVRPRPRKSKGCSRHAAGERRQFGGVSKDITDGRGISIDIVHAGEGQGSTRTHEQLQRTGWPTSAGRRQRCMLPARGLVRCGRSTVRANGRRWLLVKVAVSRQSILIIR